MTTDITEPAQRVERIISGMKLKHGDKDTYAPIMKWDEFLVLVEALEKAQQRIAKLESRIVNVKLPTTIEPTAFSPWVAKAFYQFHKDTVKSCFAVFSDACAAAGIKVEVE
ncbi:TPA: hypothetical protein OME37_000106 [Klebsiella michiganensis]|nr:hypothetical protein [Klebsiella michiganensis]